MLPFQNKIHKGRGGGLLVIIIFFSSPLKGDFKQSIIYLSLIKRYRVAGIELWYWVMGSHG